MKNSLLSLLKNKNIKKILIWSLSSLVGIILLIIFVVYSPNLIICNKVSIEFLDNKQDRLVNTADVENLMNSINGKLIGSAASKINIDILEKKLNEVAMIEDAQVSKDINGNIKAVIKQRIPIVRIINNFEQENYIDISGHFMPISKRTIARVLVANGDINERFFSKSVDELKDSLPESKIVKIFNLSKEIKNDVFLNAQIEQLYINKLGECELIPRVGKQIIYFGKIEDIKNKLEKLNYFYKNEIGKQGWQKYKLINLEFKNQIVCKK